VAMHGFTGVKTATREELPDSVAVMDPFRVVIDRRRAGSMPAPGPAGPARPPRRRRRPNKSWHRSRAVRSPRSRELRGRCLVRDPHTRTPPGRLATLSIVKRLIRFEGVVGF
jgi:hypothetical protein